jgi:hypothetical protein
MLVVAGAVLVELVVMQALLLLEELAELVFLHL